MLCPAAGAGCREDPRGHCPVLAPEHTFVHTNTHTEHSSAQWRSMEGIKHLAALECLPWKQAKDSTCPQGPGSLLLATVYLGEALILVGNMYCCFYVSRTRASPHFSSADLPFTTKYPPLSCCFAHSLCKQQIPSPEMLSALMEGG